MRSLVFTLALLPSTLLASGPEMQDGQWQITTSMSMEGMAQQMPPHTTTICLSKDDIAKGEKTVPQGGKGQNAPKCEMVDRSMSSNTFKYKMVCAGPHKATMNGEIHYDKTSYQGNSRMEMVNGQGKPMVMTQQFTAKRLGDCKK